MSPIFLKCIFQGTLSFVKTYRWSLFILSWATGIPPVEADLYPNVASYNAAFCSFGGLLFPIILVLGFLSRYLRSVVYPCGGLIASWTR